MAQLKLYVCNKVKLKGSIVEGYCFQEILTSCSRYLENVQAIFNQPRRVDVDHVGDIQTCSRVV